MSLIKFKAIDLGRKYSFPALRAEPEVRAHCGERPVRADCVEKLPNRDFEDFRQKHIFAETLRGLPRKAPKTLPWGRKPILAGPLAKILQLLCVGKYFQILLEIGVFQQN